MKHLTLLLQKEFRVFFNNYLQSPKQISKTMGIFLAVLFLIALLVNAFRRWFDNLIELIAPELIAATIPQLFFLILSWLSLIIFVSVLMDCRNKFFHTADL